MRDDGWLGRRSTDARRQLIEDVLHAIELRDLPVEPGLLMNVPALEYPVQWQGRKHLLGCRPSSFIDRIKVILTALRIITDLVPVLLGSLELD
jgi:hypothetical protein